MPAQVYEFTSAAARDDPQSVTHNAIALPQLQTFAHVGRLSAKAPLPLSTETGSHAIRLHAACASWRRLGGDHLPHHLPARSAIDCSASMIDAISSDAANMDSTLPLPT